MSNLAATYADALFEIAKEENILDEIMSQGREVSALLAATPDMMKILNTPTVSKDEKVSLIDKVFSGNVNVNLLNFMKVMAERKNTGELVESFAEFEKLYNKFNNIEKAVAITAVPLSEELSGKLTAKLEQVTGKKIILTNKVDPSCLGGIILEFSDKQYNDSIANKLANLRSQLKNI